MKTILLMSIIWATFVLPALAARREDPVRGVRNLVIWFLVATTAYRFYVAYGHTNLFPPG